MPIPRISRAIIPINIFELLFFSVSMMMLKICDYKYNGFIQIEQKAFKNLSLFLIK